MTEFLTFFIILAAGLFFAVLFKKAHLPWVTALIAAGIVIGPNGFGWFEPTVTFEFIGQIGLVFLMFMAGLEAQPSSLKDIGGKVSTVALINAVTPFLVGLAIAYFFGYSITASLLLGIIFISSSVAVAVPALQAHSILPTTTGKAIIGVTLIKDIGSLLLLSILLQSTNPITILPLPAFYAILIASLFVMRILLKKVRYLLVPKELGHHDVFEREVRIIFALLIGTVIIFEILGLHPIVAGFFAGLVLSESIQSPIFKEKLHTISYGFFIPVFFILIGAKTNLLVFFESPSALLLAAVVVVGSIISTFGSGWFGSLIAGFDKSQASLIASATIPQLSTTLAASFATLELGIIDQPFAVAIILLSITSTAIGSIMVNYYSEGISKQKKFEYAE